ncbi:MAG: 4-(cytidine 5'-diphospho)-2-C-methyl-D-erythritol kinase [Lachnospiraceae bacterium]|nr:4-(cytidine 5'-diphospho)-2-C-methyl-D-erythritol kinase [Lachnospiraceae bacterium]
MEQLTIHAHAKINLALDVLNRRPDGYHTVRMIMQSLALCDTLFLQKTEEPGIVLSARNPELFPDVTWDENNLIYKAAKLFIDTCSIQGGVHITIEKQIPSAAGLAGGSSDAAATLKGMNQLFDQNLSADELKDMGVKLGADVPYCIQLGTALSEGIGEQLTALPAAPAMYCVLVKPEAAVSTKYVYQNLKLDKAHHPDIDAALDAISTGNVNKLCANLNNILEPVARTLCPEVEDIETKFMELGARGTCMSGSGPTVFGLFTDGNDAIEASEYFLDHGYEGRAFVTKFYQPVSKRMNYADI